MIKLARHFLLVGAFVFNSSSASAPIFNFLDHGALFAQVQTFEVSQTDAQEVGVDITGQAESLLHLGMVSSAGADLSGFQIIFKFDETRLYPFAAEIPEFPDSFPGGNPSWWSHFFAVQDVPPIPDATFEATAGMGYVACLFDFQLVDLLPLEAQIVRPICNIRIGAAAGVVTEGTAQFRVAIDEEGEIPGSFAVRSLVVVETPGSLGTEYSVTNPSPPFQVVVTSAPSYLPGDQNLSGDISLADAIGVLAYLFGGQSTPCIASTDADGNGQSALADCIYILQYLFVAGDPPVGSSTCSPGNGQLPCDTPGC